MADPLLAMIGAIALAFLGIVALVSLTVIAAQAGFALAHFVCKRFQ